MSKVTSKLQVTIPKAIAEQFGIEPGDEIEFQSAGDFIRVIPPGGWRKRRLSRQERLRIFDAGMERVRKYQEGLKLPEELPTERDWRREDLYDRD